MAKPLNLPNFDVNLEGTSNFTTRTSSGACAYIIVYYVSRHNVDKNNFIYVRVV